MVNEFVYKPTMRRALAIDRKHIQDELWWRWVGCNCVLLFLNPMIWLYTGTPRAKVPVSIPVQETQHKFWHISLSNTITRLAIDIMLDKLIIDNGLKRRHSETNIICRSNKASLTLGICCWNWFIVAASPGSPHNVTAFF